MKTTIKMSPMVTELIALCYQNMQSARTYAREVASDPGAPMPVKKDFLHIAASLGAPIQRIESRIPHEIWDEFKTQLKDMDTVRLDNIKALYVRMLPEQQEMLERVAEVILTREFVLEEL